MSVISNLFRASNSAWKHERANVNEAKGIALNIGEASNSELEKTLMREIARTLEQHFPPPKGLPLWWAVEIAGSVTLIYNLALSGRMGYVIHTRNVDTKRVIQAGGEILERYGVPRDYRHYSAERIIQLHEDSPSRYLKHHA